MFAPWSVVHILPKTMSFSPTARQPPLGIMCSCASPHLRSILKHAWVFHSLKNEGSYSSIAELLSTISKLARMVLLVGLELDWCSLVGGGHLSEYVCAVSGKLVAWDSRTPCCTAARCHSVRIGV